MVIDTSALLAAADITTVPLGETHVHWALVGWWAGAASARGSNGQPSTLATASAMAMALEAPLLFKGADFAATNVQPALVPTTEHPSSIDAH